MTFTRTCIVGAGILAAATQASASNLVTNGDFEGGNAGFTSDYQYSPGTGGGGPAGVYTVWNTPGNWNGAFAQIGDHTTGPGNMMIVNGSSDITDIVWASVNISVTAGQDYFFEAYIALLYPSAPPSLTFMYSLDGGAAQTLATLTNSLQLGAWEGLSTNFNTGTATSVQLFLQNAQPSYGGNDFALDDIYLGTTSIVNPPVPGPGGIPVPATWALLMLGFGAIGSSMRQRSAAVSYA